MTRMRKATYEPVLRYLFNSVRTAEVGALEEVQDTHLVRAPSWQGSVLLLSWEPKTVMVILRGHV